MKRLLLVWLTLGTGLLQAQTESADSGADDPQWYRVEVLVFAQRSAAARLEEHWDPLPRLAYPPVMQWLTEERELRTDAAWPLQLLRIEDTVPVPALELTWEYPPPQPSYQQHPPGTRKTATIELEPLFEPDVARAFVPLPGGELRYLSESRRLHRAGDTELLFHRAWLQPMRGRAESLPMPIAGGEVRGEFSELQGSVLLYSERYLHIETNLWLNTDGEYLAGQWRMPAPPPDPIPELPRFTAFSVTLADNWYETPADPATNLGVAVPAGPATTVGAAVAVGEGAGNNLIDTDATAQPAWTEEAVAAFLAQPDYPFRHAVLLQQRRRMRRDELHFIDHPLLGVLVEISRYEFQPFVDTATTPTADQ